MCAQGEGEVYVCAQGEREVYVCAQGKRGVYMCARGKREKSVCVAAWTKWARASKVSYRPLMSNSFKLI